VVMFEGRLVFETTADPAARATVGRAMAGMADRSPVSKET